ncbi:MAG: tetratricopeptide repeat protein [Flavobacteriales bacterium]|nr:tetratricopeptide repeat protein [Flavobacteriales bacterium]
MSRTFLLLAVFVLFGLAAHAQDPHVDSLHRALKRWVSLDHRADDSLGVVLTRDLSLAYQYAGQLDSALQKSVEGLALATAGVRVADHQHRIDWLHHRMTAERVLASQLFFLNRYPESIDAVKAYLATAEELQLPEEIGAAYNYLGYCYTAMEDLPSALAWSRKAMETMRGIGGGIDLANAYTGLGNILDEMGQHDSAFHYMRKALDLHRTLDRPNNHAAAYFSAIETLRHLGLSDSADVYLARVAVLVRHLDQPRSYMHYYNLLGQRELEQGRSTEAIAHLLKADTIAVGIEDHRSRHYINRALALAYAAVGEPNRATERAELADAELKEDMGLEKVRAVSAAQAKAEQEKELATAEANAEALRKGRWFAWALAGGGLLVALLLGVLFYQGRRSAQRLAAAQEELMRMEKQREAERVRMNVSRDIHDELGGSLSKIALLSDLVQQDAAAAESGERLRSIADHARQVRGSLNDVVWAADPSSDHAGALLQHVADRAHRLLEGTGIELQLDLHADNPGQLLGPAFKRDLSMVVKEALNNALKHARPTVIALRFHIRADGFHLTVADNGRGMGHSSVDGGNGLVNMRERIATHGGTLTVQPATNGNGTVVSATGLLASV